MPDDFELGGLYVVSEETGTAYEGTGLYPSRSHDVPGSGAFAGARAGGGILADLIRVPIPYVLEVRRNGKIERAVSLPLTPSRIDVQRPPATDLTYTLGRLPVREPSEDRELQIALQGRSGLQPRTGYDAHGGVIYADGREILRQFDRFLAYYQSLAVRHGAQNPRDKSQRVELIFRAFNERLHVRVEMSNDGWRWTRDASQTRFSATWNLALHAYAPAEVERPESLFGPIADGARWLTNAIDTVNNYVAVADNALTNARGDLDELMAPLDALKRTAQLTNDIVDSGFSLAAFPLSVLASLTATARAFRSVAHNVKRKAKMLPDAYAGAVDDLTAVFEGADEVAIATETAYGGLGGTRGRVDALAVLDTLPGFSAGDAALETGRHSVCYKRHEGQTWRDVAALGDGDPREWTTIADANRLPDARHGQDGEPLVAGVSLECPNVSEQRLPFVADGEEALGVDLLVDAEQGDWRLEGNSTTRFRTVSGSANLEQALRTRLRAEYGTLALREYGLNIAVGDPLDASVRGYVAAHTAEQLHRDPRVADASKFNVFDEGDGLVLALDVVPIIGRRVDVIAPLPQ